MLKINNKVLKINSNWLNAVASPVPPGPDPYNPLGLPPYTMRFRIYDNNTMAAAHGSGRQVSVSPNIWDWTYNSSNWDSLFDGQYSWMVLEVLGANTEYVTNMNGLFAYNPNLESVALFDTSNATTMSHIFNYCSSLTSVPLFNTSSAITMEGMFYGCTSLTSVPLFDTYYVTNMNNMFNGCTNVQSGALALYQQASTQDNPVGDHYMTFTDCGSNTTTGHAELAQIPSSWGGLGA